MNGKKGEMGNRNSYPRQANWHLRDGESVVVGYLKEARSTVQHGCPHPEGGLLNRENVLILSKRSVCFNEKGSVFQVTRVRRERDERRGINGDGGECKGEWWC